MQLQSKSEETLEKLLKNILDSKLDFLESRDREHTKELENLTSLQKEADILANVVSINLNKAEILKEQKPEREKHKSLDKNEKKPKEKKKEEKEKKNKPKAPVPEHRLSLDEEKNKLIEEIKKKPIEIKRIKKPRKEEMPKTAEEEIDKAETPEISQDLKKGLQFELKPKQNPLIMSTTNSTILPVMITVKTTEIENEKGEKIQSRVPIDLLCVIDHSGSMGGVKMELVLTCLKELLNHLNEKDRLALIIFDDKAQRLLPLTSASQENIQQTIIPAIKKIKVGGGTDINKGMQMAFNEIGIRGKKYHDKVTSIFLLSDGLDNEAHKRVEDSLKSYKIHESLSINTFGFGNDHDPILMNEIAKLKDGNFYYIEKLDVVDECFVDALGAVTSEVAKELTVSLKLLNEPPLSDLRISRTYGPSFKYNEVKKEHIIHISHFAAGTTKDFILEMSFPPFKKPLDDETRNFTILHATYEAVGLKGETVIHEEKMTIILFNEQEECKKEMKINEEVDVNYMRVHGAEAIEEARKQSDSGKFEDAEQILSKAIVEINSNKNKEDKRLQILLKDISKAKELAKPSVYESKGKKFFINQKKVHMEQVSAPQGFEFEENIYANVQQKSNVMKVKMKKVSK